MSVFPLRRFRYAAILAGALLAASFPSPASAQNPTINTLKQSVPSPALGTGPNSDPPITWGFVQAPPMADGTMRSFGTSVGVSGLRMVVGTAALNSAQIFDLGSTTPTAPILTLYNPAQVSTDYFGQAVAISGTRVVVGAYGSSTGSGKVYVYDLAGASPGTPIATLSNPSFAPADLFGWSVAISGTHVVVGAYGDDTGATDAGSVYVYDLAGASPSTPLFTLRNPSLDTQHAEWFGRSVAIDGTRVVVGASKDGTGAAEAGSVYVYNLAGATPTVPATTINHPAPVAFDQFGVSVAVSGMRIVVGKFAGAHGGAYVFDLSKPTPTTPVATLANPESGSTYFGFSVAISGAVVVVGASHGNTDGKGIAYDYNMGVSPPTSIQAVLTKPATGSGFFGHSVAIDGFTLAVGAPFDSTMPDAGNTYLFGPASNDTDGDGLLDAWEYAHFGTITGHSATDDSDHDGQRDLIELAFGTDPLVANPAPSTGITIEDGYLTLTLTKRAGVTYLVQTSPGPANASFSSATTTVLIDNATTLKVRDSVPIGTQPQRMIRAKITAAP